ncbi:MAG TPA: histidine phosphatase family protein [Thermoanaerobaculia bacterium]|jgi:broad specificity phosphatase PhoE
MKSVRLAAAAALLALAASRAEAQKAILVVRHAEKASDANGKEVPLSEQGKARAERLAAMLRDAGITAICSTDTVRTRSTAEPLARALHMTIRIYGDVNDLAGELKREPDTVALVVGHGNTVPLFLTAMGVKEKIELGDREYDNLFIVVPRASGEPGFVRLRY